MKKTLLYIGIIYLCFTFRTTKGQDIEHTMEHRLGAELSYQFEAPWKISIAPEIRTDQDFRPTKHLIKTTGSYKAAKFISFRLGYRLVADKKEEQLFNQFHLGTKVSKKLHRFDSHLRLRYTNYDEETDLENENFLRIKVGTEYNINNCRLTPTVAIESIRSLQTNQSKKIRYSIAGEYKINQKSAITAAYKMDYFLQEYKNKHIISIAYQYAL